MPLDALLHPRDNGYEGASVGTRTSRTVLEIYPRIFEPWFVESGLGAVTYAGSVAVLPARRPRAGDGSDLGRHSDARRSRGEGAQELAVPGCGAARVRQRGGRGRRRQGDAADETGAEEEGLEEEGRLGARDLEEHACFQRTWPSGCTGRAARREFKTTFDPDSPDSRRRDVVPASIRCMISDWMGGHWKTPFSRFYHRCVSSTLAFCQRKGTGLTSSREEADSSPLYPMPLPFVDAFGEAQVAGLKTLEARRAKGKHTARQFA